MITEFVVDWDPGVLKLVHVCVTKFQQYANTIDLFSE